MANRIIKKKMDGQAFIIARYIVFLNQTLRQLKLKEVSGANILPLIMGNTETVPLAYRLTFLR